MATINAARASEALRTAVTITADIFESVTTERELCDNDLLLSQGLIINNRYRIIEQIKICSAQAQIVLVDQGIQQRIFKLYRRKQAPDAAVLERLKATKWSRVMPLLDTGEYEGRYYEVFPYYTKGTLAEKGKIDAQTLRNVIIPDINEGLKELHGAGFVHGDIKPENIFLTDDGQRVVLGDIGVSSQFGSGRPVALGAQGTYLYRVPEKQVGAYIYRTFAYDYGSMGLTIITLATGKPLFEGKTPEEVDQFWLLCQKGRANLNLPKGMETYLEAMVRGLLVLDEENRFSYDDIARLCGGRFIASRADASKARHEKERKPYRFAVIDRYPVYARTPEELGVLMRKHWDKARECIGDGVLFKFLNEWDEALGQYAQSLTHTDTDAAVFMLSYRLAMDEQIVFRNSALGSLEALLQKLQGERECDEDFECFLKLDLLTAYLKEVFDADNMHVIEQAKEYAGWNEKLYHQILAFLCLGERVQLELEGASIYTADDLIDVVMRMDAERLKQIASAPKLMAWLYMQGYEAETSYARGVGTGYEHE